MQNYDAKSLIDLISEKHMQLRSRLHDTSGEQVNKTEAHILALLRDHGCLTASEIGRIINISRQGTHKCIQGLTEAGLVEADHSGERSRDKPLSLTDRGRDCSESMERTKRLMEREIAERLGIGNVDLMKKLLQEDWFPEREQVLIPK